MPRLRVLAGSSLSSLVPITELVNTGTAQRVSSDLFDGQIAVHIKGLTDEHGHVRSSEYFERNDKQDITWSIQVEGRFLQPYSADDILFGNTFDRPLHLPWGSSAVLQFMTFIDPTLEHDLQSQRPWALSPLISTMPHFAHRRMPEVSTSVRTFPSSSSLHDDTSELYLASIADPCSGSSTSSSASSSSLSLPSSVSSSSVSPSMQIPSLAKKLKKAKSMTWRRKHETETQIQTLTFPTAKERRSYFSDRQRRKDIVFGPQDVIATDFCYGFLEFSPSLALRLPGGLSFDLVKYWDGQPVRFVCCERKAGQGGDPWGKLFWCVSIELVEDGDEMGETGQFLSETID